MKRGLLITLILLLSLAAVQAVDVTYEVIHGDILPGDTPEYLLNINNNENYDIDVSLSQLSSVEMFRLKQENQFYLIKAGDSKTITLTFTPQSTPTPGVYGIHTVVKTQNSRLEKVLPLTVVDPGKALDLKFVPSAVLDPRRPVILSLNVINKYSIEYKNLELILQSPNFEYSTTFDLGKHETKILNIPIQVDKETEEGNYNVQGIVRFEEKKLADLSLPYSISSYENVKQIVEPESRFLYSGESVTKVNEGNTRVQEFYSKDFDYVAFKLASFSPEPTTIEKKNGNFQASWSIPLEPGEAKTVSYAVNYRIPTLIIVLILVGLAAWHVFRRKNAIVVTKKLLTLHAESGKLHTMKVLIHVKNRGNVAVKDIKLVDKVPASVSAPAKYGLHQPSKIQSIPEGTAMVWNIPVIPASHEKLLSYVIECKAQTVASAVLPPARAKYVLFGRQLVASSSPLALKGKKESM